MTERWVINASPLILLGKAGQLGCLPRLGKIVVPGPVADEILAGTENDPARLWLEQGEGKSLITPGAAVQLSAAITCGANVIIAEHRRLQSLHPARDDARRVSGRVAPRAGVKIVNLPHPEFTFALELECPLTGQILSYEFTSLIGNAAPQRWMILGEHTRPRVF